MKKRTQVHKTLFIAVVFNFLFATISAAEIVIIVNKDNPANSISKAELRRIFLGKATELSGKKILPLNQIESSPSRHYFNKTILKKTSSQIKAYWSKQLFTGKGVPPKELSGDIDVLQAVAEGKSYIGYIDIHVFNSSVKQISVD